MLAFLLQDRALTQGDEGGCPFRHFDQAALQKELLAEDIPESHQQNILALCQQDRCNDACRAFLMARVGGSVEVKRDQMLSESPDTADGLAKHVKDIAVERSVEGVEEAVSLCEGEGCPCGTQHGCRSNDVNGDRHRSENADVKVTILPHNKGPSSGNPASLSKRIKMEIEEKPMGRCNSTFSTKCIYKPLDFYRSYNKLVEGLRQ